MLAYCGEDQDSPGDGADELTIHGHRGRVNTLKDGFHGRWMNLLLVVVLLTFPMCNGA